MKNLIVRSLLSLTIFTCFASAQTCPNWSSKFDKISNPEVIKKLKAMPDWDTVVAQSGGAAQIIAAFTANLKTAKDQRARTVTIIKQLYSGPGDPMDFHVTYAACQKASGALMAAQCEYLNMTDLILTSEGSIDLAQCRLNNGQ
jgi:hypothetical protein